jgi:PAS domain S-box-containing protein
MLQGLFELVPDALLAVDSRGTIVRANDHAERLFGHPAGGLQGRPVEALLPEALRERHRRHRADYMAQPRPRPMGGTRMSLVGLRGDGTRFPVEISLGPLAGSEPPLVLALVRDISGSQLAHQVLVRARYDALLARIAHLALLHNDDDLVVQRLPRELADALDAQVVAVVFGDRVEELHVAAAHGIAPELLEARVRACRAPSLARALLGNTEIRLEALFDPAHGGSTGAYGADPCPGEGLAMPMADHGAPLGLLLVLDADAANFDHDVRHLVHMAADLLSALIQHRRTQDQLAHARRREALGQLTGGIAHDFNNVLTVAAAHLEALADEHALDPAAGHDLAQARRALSRGADLADKLLAFARQRQLAPRAVSPCRALDELASLLARTLGAALRLRVECAPGVPDVLVDPSMLETALVNLAFNARDAMPQGGEITLSARVAGAPAGSRPGSTEGYVAIGVGDTGTGMDPATLARAVEPYFSTRDQGTGLGLSMVYGFAKQSGGHLRIDSRPGSGTRVDLLLPALLPAVATEAAP